MMYLCTNVSVKTASNCGDLAETPTGEVSDAAHPLPRYEHLSTLRLVLLRLPQLLVLCCTPCLSAPPLPTAIWLPTNCPGSLPCSNIEPERVDSGQIALARHPGSAEWQTHCLHGTIAHQHRKVESATVAAFAASS